jgi:methionine aminopeptidase
MSINSDKDLAALRKIGRIVARCLQHMQSKLEPGITTGELDDIGGDFLAAHGARSAPRLTYNFPGHTCISVNEEAAHGIPGPRALKAGDLVNIDVSAELEGYFDERDQRILRANQVITIEPFISSGAREVFENGDGWTLVTKRGLFTAQYEHTLVITQGRPLIMTLLA